MKTVADLRAYCLTMTGAYEDFPFGPDASIMKVKEKMFALIVLDSDPPTISLKCDPTEAIMLREQYQGIEPARYLSKKHWNGIIVTDEISAQLIREMIEDSYILVRQKLTKRAQNELDSLESDS